MNSTKKSLRLVCTFLFILILSACERAEQIKEEIPVESEPSVEESNSENEPSSYSYSFINPNTGQEFTILHAYLLYENYFEAIKNNPKDSPYDLYQQVIIDPIYDACFKNAEYEKLSIYEWTPEESNLSSLKKQIVSINTDHINKLYEESLVKSSDILPTDKKTTVCVFPKNEKSPSDMVTAGAGKIFVYFNGITHYTKSGMSHEYHHSVWTEKHYKDNYFMTVLDGLIMEGEAVMFETIVYPDLNSTTFVLDERFNKDYWSTIETYLESGHSNEFIIGGAKGLPINYGYSEGYKMIRSYINLHPDMSVEEWTSKSPKVIFEEGNYLANYE